MTTDVKVRCNGPNYRSVIKRGDRTAYVYHNHQPKPGEQFDPSTGAVAFHVGENSPMAVGEEYSATGWDQATDQPIAPPAADPA